MKKNKIGKRLLVGILAVVFTFCGASEVMPAQAINDKQDVVIVDEVIDHASEAATDEVVIYTPEIEEISISKVDTLQNEKNNSEVFSTVATGIQEVNLLMRSFEPYKNTCLIMCTFPNGKTYSSSGTMVGKNVVLIAAHGVYKQEYGGEATSIKVFIGLYNFYDTEEICANGFKKNLILPRSWVESELPKSDWALIVLQNDYTSYQKVGYATDYTQVIGRSVTTAGYPKETLIMNFSCGEITGTTDNKWDEANKGLWKLSTSAVKGMSGGPVMDNETGAIIGLIHGIDDTITHETVAVPLTEFIVDVIKQYRSN